MSTAISPPDVIVVGAGTAGCVVAAHLSEQSSRRVLLLEAGPDHDDGGADVAEPAEIRGRSMFDTWTLPSRQWPDLRAHVPPQGPSRPYLMGRGVGGSSSVNAMVADVGRPADYDRWERDYGCQGWGWSVMGPVLQRLASRCRIAEPYEWGVVGRALLAAGRGSRVAPVRLSRDGRGERLSAARTMLDPVRRRPNLSVRSNSTVRRVLIDRGRAVGVELTSDEVIEVPSPGGEVVVCAGALLSPTLLWRSGVELRGLGHGLSDHPSASISLALDQPVDPSSVVIAVGAHLDVGDAEAVLQIMGLNHLGRDSPAVGALMLGLMAPSSRGRLVFDAMSSEGPPGIELGHLTDERDVDHMVHGVGLLRDLLEHPAMRRVVSACTIDEHGTPFESLFDDPEVVASWVRRYGGGFYHASGTCRMGPRRDDYAVVDTRCRVHGVDGLRVVDASIMPALPRANPMLTVLAVADVACRYW